MRALVWRLGQAKVPQVGKMRWRECRGRCRLASSAREPVTFRLAGGNHANVSLWNFMFDKGPLFALDNVAHPTVVGEAWCTSGQTIREIFCHQPTRETRKLEVGFFHTTANKIGIRQQHLKPLIPLTGQKVTKHLGVRATFKRHQKHSEHAKSQIQLRHSSNENHFIGLECLGLGSGGTRDAFSHLVPIAVA